MFYKIISPNFGDLYVNMVLYLNKYSSLKSWGYLFAFELDATKIMKEKSLAIISYLALPPNFHTSLN